MIPLFLSDLDGTLIHKEPIIDPEDVLAIKQWQKEGNHFGLVTGRDRIFCLELLNRYEITPDCLITCNGAMTFWKDVRVDASLIDIDVAKKIFYELKNYLDCTDPFFTAEDGSNYFMAQDIERIQKAYAKLGRIQKIPLMTYLASRSEGLAKISISTGSFENTQRLLPIFKAKFSEVEVMPTSVDYIEITRKQTDKAHAMNKLIEHQHLNLDDIIFVGDGENDIPLFDMLERTYVIQSASDEIKKHAKQTTIDVANAIQKEREYR